MNQCLICKSEGKYPLCKKCAKNPFLVEKVRQILASIGDLVSLKNTYYSKSAEIKNLNTGSFWNKKLSNREKLENQDGMTKDRIKTAFKFIPKGTKNILDIGAGHGFIEELLSRNKNIKIFGNDISNIAVKELKSKFKGQFLKESIYGMKYKAKLFDVIFMLEILEHIPPSKVFSVLKKVKEMLKEKGWLIISLPTNEGLEKASCNPSGHVRTYTENLITAELKIAGFTISKLRRLYAFKSMYMIKKISSKILRNRWEPNDIVILAKAL